MESVIVAGGSPQAEALGFIERRRAGRPEAVSGNLIPLLRGTAQLSSDISDDQFGDPDHLRPARALGFALLLSVPLWGFLIGAIWLAMSFVALLQRA